jgi:hypothetical protein
MAASAGSIDLSSMDLYRSLCKDKFYELFGVATDPLCGMIAIMRYLKIVSYILLAFDLFLVVWFMFKFLPGWARRLWDDITGNKKVISQVINMTK